MIKFLNLLHDHAHWRKPGDSIVIKLKTTNQGLQVATIIATVVLAITAFINAFMLEKIFFLYLIISILASIVAFPDQWRYKFHDISKEEQQLISKVEHFLKTNNLYIREDGIITDSVTVVFEIWKHKLGVRLISEGSKFTDRLREMDGKL